MTIKVTYPGAGFLPLTGGTLTGPVTMAAGATLAVNGATIGADALAVTGTANFSGTVKVNNTAGFIVTGGFGIFNNTGTTAAFRNTGNTLDTGISAASAIFSGVIRGANATLLDLTVDGRTLLQNSAQTSFNLLQLGGTTSAFGAVKYVSSGPKIAFRLADDSADLQTTAKTVLGVALTVATLPAAASNQGAIAFVTDATQTAIAGLGLTVVGGGTNKVVVYSDGANWLII